MSDVNKGRRRGTVTHAGNGKPPDRSLSFPLKNEDRCLLVLGHSEIFLAEEPAGKHSIG
jgi:hypothetical protein